jgi:hypothetical protein
MLEPWLENQELTVPERYGSGTPRMGFRGSWVELCSPAAMLALLRNKSHRPDSVSPDLTMTCWVGAFCL